MTEWESVGSSPSDIGPEPFDIVGSHSPDFRYLPGPAEVNNIGSWDYTHQMSMYESTNPIANDLAHSRLPGNFC